MGIVTTTATTTTMAATRTAPRCGSTTDDCAGADRQFMAFEVVAGISRIRWR
jgi:hypothetical protein